MDVRNPRTGEVDYAITPVTVEELTATCSNLRQAQVNWDAIGVDERIKIMHQWKEVLLESRNELLAAISTDTGRWRESLRETDNLPRWIDRWTKVAQKQFISVVQDTEIKNVQKMNDYSPYPLVGVISPWNFPMALSLMDAIPALLAGCAVIIKPSEITPRFVEPLMATIQKVPVLRDVLTYVVGAGDTGHAVLEQVDMVCFTGGVSTGRKVAVEAAKRFIPVFTELGGKDPAIILASADIENATSSLLIGSVLGAGHQCYSIERIYVARSIHDAFVESIVNKARKLDLAYPDISKGEIGPIIHAPQADIIQEHLRDALEKGAKVQLGGKIENLGGGLWCRPTVLTNVDHSMKIMTEETFGPIMSIMAFDDENEAVRLANDTPYGLSAAVFAGTVDEALVIAKRIDAGGISINDSGMATLLVGEEGLAEKTSFKASGLGGSRIGSESIKRFVRKRALISKTTLDQSYWWFEDEIMKKQPT